MTQRLHLRLLTLLLLAGCARDDAFRSIVLISVDTLRADHLGAYGYPRPTSPFLDSLAAQGVVFERAFAATSSTAPSHASMLTGLHPTQHGLRRNGQKLPADAVLLTQLLAQDGWQTAGFVSTSAHFSVGGMAAGFQHFDEPQAGAAKAERGSQATIGAAIRWLREREAQAPLFLWVHLFDPHSPYQPRERLRDPPGQRPVFTSFFLAHHRTPLDFFGGDAELLAELMESYDGEILGVDRGIRALHDAFAQTQGSEDSLWIVTADHGEGLGNHGWLLHGKNIYNEQVRVPLVFHAPGRFAPARVGGIAHHVDLLPTLLAVAGLEAPPDLPGISLLPTLRGEESLGRRFALSERRSFTPRRRTPASQRPSKPSLHDLVQAGIQDNFAPGESYALQDERFKLIWNSELGSELYDLAADPYETEEVSERYPEAARELREQLEQLLESLRAKALREPVVPVDEETRRALEALGYVDS